jgi:hypothetical protein
VEEKIARRGDRMPRAGLEFPKGVQLFRPWFTKQPIPCVGPYSQDAGEISLDIAEANGTQQSRQIAAERPNRCPARLARVDGHDQEDRGSRQRLNDCLWAGGQTGLRTGFGQ